MKEKNLTVGDLHKWVDKNYLWLTEWLTNVVTVDDLEKDRSTATFQTFRTPITSEPPFGLLDAGNVIKGQLIVQSTIGAMSLNPPQFPGFLQKVGRLPKEGDQMIYTALKWFKLEYISESPLILAENTSVPKIPVLTTICAVDYLVK